MYLLCFGKSPVSGIVISVGAIATTHTGAVISFAQYDSDAKSLMKYYTRRFIRPNDLNMSHRLFGGQLLSWIDEESAIYAACQMKHERVVTKYMSEIDFKYSAGTGDILEFGLEVVTAGNTSLTSRCEVRHKISQVVIITVERIVFVAVDSEGRPTPHGYRQHQCA